MIENTNIFFQVLKLILHDKHQFLPCQTLYLEWSIYNQDQEWVQESHDAVAKDQLAADVRELSQ